ncbi:peptidylprolyl isomerase [Algirhabdus cladophorae]|uniref:peptidylprolyl isomerase n=1 Tax=Algirhabdus cladophorae TaxID=3377108 RepID=UPI003B845C17
MRIFHLVIAMMVLAMPAVAQSQFSAVKRINDRVITAYELQQRALFLQVLRAPGNVQETAMEQLIEERLKQDILNQIGQRISDDAVLGGMEEFAGRANLTAEQFTQAIGQAGVDRESFRDFVKVGLGWREFVRGRFGPQARVSEDEIDRRIALASNGSGLRVLMSEIILPNVPQLAAQTASRVEEISKITTLEGFASAARRYSFAPTRARSGRLDWLPLSNLPPQLRQIVLSLRPGQVSAPIPLENALIIFQLRDIEEAPATPAELAAVEYAAFYIPGGRSDAALAQAEKIKAQVDTCDDLYGVAQGLPEERLDRGSLAPADIPQDIAVELAKLDPNEVSTVLTRANGQTLVFLMLCSRTPDLGQDIDREQIRNTLFNERIESLSQGFLDGQRADAVIRDP